MPRKKPTSTRQKKAAVQLSRAVKRGDVEKPEPKPLNRKRKGHMQASNNQAGQASARKLQSAFTKLSTQFLDETKTLSSVLPLPRPLPIDASILPEYTLSADQDTTIWSCPKRPKWNYEMSKKDVEANEEGIFKKWLSNLDAAVETWRDQDKRPEPMSENEIPAPRMTMPRSPTYFERNIDVWRQLWRVTEISQIILVLLDSRCPLLHYPASLAVYLKDRKHILVLTKVDIVGPERADEWLAYFKKHYPSLQVVPVESYAEKQATIVHQGRKQYQPSLPDSFRERLVDAIKKAHQELLDAPPVKGKKGVRIGKVKETIDWATVRSARGGKVGTIVGGASEIRAPIDDADHEGLEEGSEEIAEPVFLTVGLIGQPNVGKSSLLNALFGTSKVRASKTPGMTKHLQTMFWTSDIRLVDCPGLVMPNVVPMEMQVLSGILPISRISAVPACVHFACQHLPLEILFKLTNPNTHSTAELEAKRTWRSGTTREPTKEPSWTAMDVLTGYAEQKGWLTAKAGRPDIHRAGNSMLRGLAEGRIAWAFWPAGTDITIMQSVISEGAGVWIPENDAVSDEEEDEESEEDEAEQRHDSEAFEEEDAESASEEDVEEPATAGVGRFSALMAIEDEDDDKN